MNFKQLFPTFRNRYLFVGKRLKKYGAEQAFDRALNLGTGEGDYDRMIAGYCRELIGCDVNEEDIAHARTLNKGVMNLRYEVNDALNLTYPDAHFDLVVSCEVIEHVGRPAQMIREIHRVLQPGGIAILTFPSREFPITYDPINRIWQWFRKENEKEYLISQGAYAFGHEYLIGSKEFKAWAGEMGFQILEFRGLSAHLTGLLEMYWTGLVQRIFKKNARNVTEDAGGAVKIRPASSSTPILTVVTDAIIALDHLLFSWIGSSCGKGVVLRKRV